VHALRDTHHTQTVVRHLKQTNELLKTKETKYENNWREKSLENSEKDYWGEPDYDSHLVKTCHQLRKKPLKDFEIEDLRIMIGQNIGLKFLVPIAIEELKENILTEGDYFEGDLLKSVLTSEVEFWSERFDLLDELDKLIQQNLELLDQTDPEFTKEFKRLKSRVK